MIDESGRIDSRTLVIPALGGLYGTLAPLSYAFIRIVVALVFLSPGIDKVFFGGAARIATGNIARLGLTPPFAWAWAVAVLEFAGAILLGLGLFTRPVAFAILVELAVIVFGISLPRGFSWHTNGAEVALVLEIAMVGFVFGGGGRYSLDRLIGREF